MASTAYTMTSRTVHATEPAGNIDWYVEQRGNGPDVVLVPSGEGDCGSFEAVARALAADFRVTTFDMPGFSRSKTSGNVDVSLVSMSGQIAGLIRILGISQATFYGCSSAGLAILDLMATNPQLVHRAVVHEAALPEVRGDISPITQLAQLDDAGISAACTAMFENFMNEDPVAWRALGDSFHKRLSANYPIWVRKYVAGPAHPPIDPATLSGGPITWTIGGLMEVRFFFSNVRLAHRAGIDLDVLPCKHFPQVSMPGALADHIRAAATTN